MAAARDGSAPTQRAAEQLVRQPDDEYGCHRWRCARADVHRHGRRRHSLVRAICSQRSGREPLSAEPDLIPAFQGAGIQYFGSDASKPYPNPSIAGSTTEAYPAGSTFTDGTAQAIPRYPTNIYYNVSTEAQEVDEFNALYTPVAQGGKCVASSTTTCETSPATFAGVVSDVDTNMFQHVMGNDPASALLPSAEHDGLTSARSGHCGDASGYPAECRRRPVLLGAQPAAGRVRRSTSTPRSNSRRWPRSAQLLAEQQAWSKASAGQVSGYIEGNKVTIQNSGARNQHPAHGRHGCWIGIWRHPVRMDERAGRDEHTHRSDRLAGRPVGHDQPPEQDRHGGRKRDVYGGGIRCARANGAVAGLD